MNFDSNLFLAPNRYYDRYFDKQAVKILPGEYYVTSQGIMIVTVLGSCVSACIRDTSSGIGGMNHFLLPGDNAPGSLPNESARYGAYAMELLINHLLKLGAAKRNLEAKIFGGGNVLPGLVTHNVGSRNGEFVMDYLATEGIEVAASDIGGQYPRKVYFFPDSGIVRVKKLRTMHNTTILDRESEYRMRVKQNRGGGDVELFD